MEYITLVVIFAAMAAMTIFLIMIADWIAAHHRARRDFRSTVEGLAVRTHQAARMDQQIARGSPEMTEATLELMIHVAEVQDNLALERKLRKALASSSGPSSADPPSRRRESLAKRGVSA